MPATTSTAPLEVLLASISADSDVRKTLPAMLAGADWNSLVPVADAHGLLPMLWWRARESGVEIPQPWQDRLRGRFEENVRSNLALTGELISLIRDFGSAGIPALAYKGPAFALAVHHQLGLRESSDIDLLVAPEAVAKARELLEQRGYATTYLLSARQLRAFLKNECELDFSAERGRMVDLHWNIVPRHYGVAVEFEPMWQRRRLVSLGDTEVPIFSPADTVLVIAIHGTKHMWSRLCWLWDLAEALQQPDMNWPELLRFAKDSGAEGMLMVGLALAQDLLRAPCDPDVYAAIESNPACRKVAADIKARLLRNELGAADANRWLNLLRLRPGWMDRAACVAKYLFSSGVGEWSMVRLPDAFFPLYSLVRVARIVGGRKSRL
jgi:hypothetical protein